MSPSDGISSFLLNSSVHCFASGAGIEHRMRSSLMKDLSCDPRRPLRKSRRTMATDQKAQQPCILPVTVTAIRSFWGKYKKLLCRQLPYPEAGLSPQVFFPLKNSFRLLQECVIPIKSSPFKLWSYQHSWWHSFPGVHWCVQSGFQQTDLYWLLLH